ncbi:MAG: hypothetical protein CXR30_15915 [Geobacter sp.]|nr:MAG: hypothetical protein CXR30_15915 [Geobacter sp.]
MTVALYGTIEDFRTTSNLQSSIGSGFKRQSARAKVSVKVAGRRALLLAALALLKRQSPCLVLWEWGEESKSKKLVDVC